MARIKYIRVSTQEQNTARQEVDKERFDRVYIEKAGGKNTDRPELKAMLDYVREGDVVEVESLPRKAWTSFRRRNKWTLPRQQDA